MPLTLICCTYKVWTWIERSLRHISCILLPAIFLIWFNWIPWYAQLSFVDSGVLNILHHSFCVVSRNVPCEQREKNISICESMPLTVEAHAFLQQENEISIEFCAQVDTSINVNLWIVNCKRTDSVVIHFAQFAHFVLDAFMLGI